MLRLIVILIVIERKGVMELWNGEKRRRCHEPASGIWLLRQRR